MFVSRVGATRLSSQRLDADFYRPEFLENEAKLLTNNVAKLGDVGHFFAGPFGSLLPSYLYLDEGVPLFRVGNVGQFEVMTDNFAYLAPHVHNELKTSEVRPGDLLVVKASVGEKICKVPDWIPKANITQHIIGIRPNGTFDTDFVSAFLFSNFGVLQLQRYSLGSIIQYLGITDAKGTYIVKADSVAQKYIGDKVRQAERLRDWGKAIHAEVGNTFETLLGVYDKTETLFEHVSPDFLSDRLDQNHYRKPLLNCLKLIGNHPHVGLSDSNYFVGLTDGDHGNPKYGAGPIYLRASEMSGGLISLNSVVTIDSDHAASVSSSCWAKPGDVIFSIVGTLGLTAIVDEQTTGVMSRGIAKVKSKILPNYYLKAFFKTNYFQSQLERHSVGSVQRGVYLSALEQIIVPVFDAQTHEQLAMKEKLADDMFRTSNSLTQAAKLLVEALIEGQLDEYQLIAAEQALQSGNDLPDRQILNRIKTDGVDGQGQALFSDLDQLYSLLEQANHS
jgi:type I restriction enzyme S subunit